MIDWFKPEMTGRELFAVQDVLESGYWNDGPVTRRFEEEIAAISGRLYGVAVCNGTSAISLSLMACDVSGDVIVPALTFIATANAARLAGCNVILADVEADNFCLSARTVDAVRTAKTSAVIAVEVNGRHPDWMELRGYCEDEGIILISDSCEALGMGGRNESVASAFSFSPQKLITTGQGGMVVTSDVRIYKKLQALKRQGMHGGGTGGADKHPTLGFNFKFTDIQAAIGLEQLKDLQCRISLCKQRDQHYRNALSGVDGIEFPREVGARLWTDILVDNQLGIHTELDRNNIGNRCFWYPLNKQRPYRFNKKFPVAQDISSRGIWLPSAWSITHDEIGQVADCIKDYLHGRNSRAA